MREPVLATRDLLHLHLNSNVKNVEVKYRSRVFTYNLRGMLNAERYKVNQEFNRIFSANIHAKSRI